MTRHTVVRAPIALAAAVVLLLTLALPASAQAPVTRLESGPSTSDQSIAWSQASFADDSAPTVIIARDDDFADALGSGAVQGALQAPLLLTETNILLPAVAAEITRLGAEQAVILGGEDAISQTVILALEALGLETEVVAGETRLETAIAIVNRFFPTTTEVVLARAFGTEADQTQAFADSLTVAPFSAASNIPVLLTDSDELSAVTADALADLPVQRVLIVGGTDAVSTTVETAAEAAIDSGEAGVTTTVDRVAGLTRFDTAVLLNSELFYTDASTAPRIILSEGQDNDAWASGFPAGAQAGNGAATVLSNGEVLPPETLEYITGANVPLICGPGVSVAACDAAVDAINS
jgi:putative cell wall-binding protein